MTLDGRFQNVPSDMRAEVFSYPRPFPQAWGGALTQARINRDLAFLSWCAGNFQPRWLGDNGRRLLPMRGQPTPGIPYACYDPAFGALAWPAAAMAAADAFWVELDAEYEIIVAEIAAWAGDLGARQAERAAYWQEHRDGLHNAYAIDFQAATVRREAARAELAAAVTALGAAPSIPTLPANATAEQAAAFGAANGERARWDKTFARLAVLRATVEDAFTAAVAKITQVRDDELAAAANPPSIAAYLGGEVAKIAARASEKAA